jgi:hypothetical protein
MSSNHSNEISRAHFIYAGCLLQTPGVRVSSAFVIALLIFAHFRCCFVCMYPPRNQLSTHSALAHRKVQSLDIGSLHRKDQQAAFSPFRNAHFIRSLVTPVDNAISRSYRTCFFQCICCTSFGIETAIQNATTPGWILLRGLSKMIYHEAQRRLSTINAETAYQTCPLANVRIAHQRCARRFIDCAPSPALFLQMIRATYTTPKSITILICHQPKLFDEISTSFAAEPLQWAVMWIRWQNWQLCGIW